MKICKQWIHMTATRRPQKPQQQEETSLTKFMRFSLLCNRCRGKHESRYTLVYVCLCEWKISRTIVKNWTEFFAQVWTYIHIYNIFADKRKPPKMHGATFFFNNVIKNSTKKGENVEFFVFDISFWISHWCS